MGDPGHCLSTDVAALLAETPSGTVEVILVLHEDDSRPSPGDERREQVELHRESFRAWSDPVADHVWAVGGRVLDRAWINTTLKVEAPASRVRELAEHARVRSVERATRL